MTISSILQILSLLLTTAGFFFVWWMLRAALRLLAQINQKLGTDAGQNKVITISHDPGKPTKVAVGRVVVDKGEQERIKERERLYPPGEKVRRIE